MRDHRGNRNVERMIETVNKKLRRFLLMIKRLQRDSIGISNILSALRTEKGADGKSAFEKQTGGPSEYAKIS